ncbi:hypothetical protein J4210_05095 [Candidatus Woesearchaeota archaeon]|nr:hypothetical protein [Candidatus Woesearchaeota archaeon]
MNQQKVAEWVLRIGVSGMFLGHGIFALSAKVGWIPLITAFGFSETTAVAVMPFIGIMDLIVAFFTLFWPLRIVLCWATIWAFATGLARPIAGEPIWDFIERFANWAAPLALLVLQGFPRKVKDWFTVR